ncbi:pyruvate dehydrogenase complex dihydrolipoamide acetyltransferase [Batrachochytrium salamandrivorans]|nr:pyruvate dehydrogenase complex dihydrolipoamide acetyltransferase [Batrachochytrium salamandrivorans]
MISRCQPLCVRSLRILAASPVSTVPKACYSNVPMFRALISGIAATDAVWSGSSPKHLQATRSAICLLSESKNTAHTQRRSYASSRNLGKWHKKIGDPISPGDILVEIETDKAQMDFECQEEGFLAKMLLPAGEKDVAVNTPIAVIAESLENIESFSDYTASATPVASTAASSEPVAAAAAVSVSTPISSNTTSSQPASTDRIFASPVAKALASARGLSLAKIVGSGPGGRIVKSDVENYTAPTTVVAPVVPSSVPAPPVSGSTGSLFTDIPLSNVRKVISSRLTQSKSTIPHFYLTVEINVDKILKLREVFNKESNGKFKLSVNDFVIKASGLALKDVPEVNSAWHETFIRQHHTADIAIAVATESGLITPIVSSVEAKGIAAISNKTKELAEKARAGKLAPHEYQGGTFTISNLGMFGVQHFTAIINPPHAAILAVGSVEDKLVLDDLAPKGFRAQKTMHVTLSNDHRVVDGAVGAKWLQRFKQYLENPLSMLL